MRAFHLSSALLAATLLLSPASAAADTTLCVGDVAALRTALQAWTTAPPGVFTIAVMRGTLSIDSAAGATLGQFASSSTASLRLLGGYGPDCAERVLDPRTTVVDGRNEFGAKLQLIGVRGDVLIEGISFTRLSDGVDVVHDGSVAANGHRLRVAHSRIVGNDTTRGSGVAYTLRLWGVGAGSGAEVAVENSLIANNVNQGFSLTSVLTTGSGGRVVLTGSTIARNRVDVGAAGIRLQTFATSGISYLVTNNIAWGNGTAGVSYDIDVSNAQTPAVTYTLAGAIDGAIAPTATNLAADPRFLSAAAGNFRLAPDSPALDAGDLAQAALPATDLDGAARVAGAAPDPGAYEDLPGDRIFYGDLGG
ncbi:choice-of-anchor Q domain-containing protein [Tahibacter sp. UC22_41]|uniref:choice-of-anchor Q domain-containing protein n=1 Tax=Tahibacter sp. UC22_41 TaxID=3350178 RepID=UPI0036D7AB51